MNPTREQIAQALQDAAHAHHDYEANVLKGVHDKAWAGWYAAYTLGRLGDFVTPTQLTQLLDTVPSADDWFQSATQHILDFLNNR